MRFNFFLAYKVFGQYYNLFYFLLKAVLSFPSSDKDMSLEP